MSPCIMGLTTQDPYIQKEHTELYKILKLRVNWAIIHGLVSRPPLYEIRQLLHDSSEVNFS